MEYTGILMMLMLGGGGQNNDLASVLPVEKYFQTQRVPLNLDNMIYLAGMDPVDGKAQIRQLVALRVLADRAQEVKKAKNAAEIITTLEKIAKGERAKDRLGFAPEYAATALAKIKGKGKAVEPKAGNLRDQTLGWFPAAATLVAAMDLRPTATASSSKALQPFLEKAVPNWEPFFNVAHQLGNIRLDRISFAFVADPAGQGKDQFFARVSGKADQKRLVEAFKGFNDFRGLVVQEQKDAQGTPIAILQERNGPPVAFIGDTDFVFTGYNRPRDNHRELFDLLLAVRAGKKPSALKGGLKDALSKTSAKASGFLVGAVPEEVRRDLARGPRGFPVVPTSLHAELFRTKEGLHLQVKAVLPNAQDAKAFTQAVGRLRQQALDELKKIPAEVPFPPGSIDALRKTLESIQVMAKDNTVQGSILAPGEALLTVSVLLTGR